MALASNFSTALEEIPRDRGPRTTAWTRTDTLSALGWLAFAMIIRAPLIARIEGILDHDQATVGLMALDISHATRFPIFFDGQRYMGAVEAYVAALFARVLGHSPIVVALAPALFFALFVAGQYAVWRAWMGRSVGNVAALLTAVGSPMLALWSVASRGGYTVILAWAMPVFAIYRFVCKQGAPKLSPRSQAGWGFLLAFGYFLNPLSLIIYATLAIDWTFGRHGSEIRSAREALVRHLPIKGRWGFLVWIGTAALTLLLLGSCCHVEHVKGAANIEYRMLFNRFSEPWGTVLGGLGILAIVSGFAWWTGAAARTLRLLTSHPWFVLGFMAALTPFLIYNARVLFFHAKRDSSLAIWIRAPWKIGPNLSDGLRATGPLIGADPEEAVFSVYGEAMRFTREPWRSIDQALLSLSPWLVALVATLVVSVVWKDRDSWRRWFALESDDRSPPTVLATLGILVMSALYLLQATSANATSMRYLIPLWVFLPGLLATAVLRLDRNIRILMLGLIMSTWMLAQICVWSGMERGSPVRPLVTALEERQIRGIIAPTHVVLLAADLSSGRIGGLEFHSNWSRLRDRYADRFKPGEPITCIIDNSYVWYPGDGLDRRLKELAALYPNKVRVAWKLNAYDVWEVKLPLRVLFDDHPGARLPEGLESANLNPR